MDDVFFDSLFEGDSANGVKLGMGVTGGDFWPRPAGCSVLYRGSSIEMVDFANIVAVVGLDAEQISPPVYIQHDSGQTYFYVVRRANQCGEQEQTCGCAVRVAIDDNGQLALAEPNDIFELRVERLAGSKVRLVWFYCPIEQKSEPARFRVYCDGRSGQVDYENPVGPVGYAGRRYYSYESASLDAGRYQFAVRAEDAAGTEDGSFAKVAVEIDAASPAGIDILSAEMV